MAKWGKCDFSEFKKLQERLKTLERIDLDKFCRDASKELAARLLALVIPKTPVGVKPKFEGTKTVRAEGVYGHERTFATAKYAAYQQYWNGYIGGTLRRGWTAKTHEEAENSKDKIYANKTKEYAQSLSVQKSGNEYTIEVINPVKYASYVEFGHRQTSGRYVPAIGKKLKSGMVDGKYFLTVSEKELREIAPGILKYKLHKILREVMNGENKL